MWEPRGSRFGVARVLQVRRAYKNFIPSFDDCRVPASAILGEEGKGFELANG